MTGWGMWRKRRIKDVSKGFGYSHGKDGAATNGDREGYGRSSPGDDMVLVFDYVYFKMVIKPLSDDV